MGLCARHSDRVPHMGGEGEKLIALIVRISSCRVVVNGSYRLRQRFEYSKGKEKSRCLRIYLKDKTQTGRWKEK
jgi:hypothetical protein